MTHKLGVVVLATMLYPDEPDKRQRYLDTLAAKALIESGARLSNNKERLASHVAGEFESVLDEGSESGYGEAVAGDLLLFIINATLYSP